MQEEMYFVKSFEEDFATKTLQGKKKVTYQNVYDIIKTRKIKPNTKSFGRKRRLSCTILSDNYTKTYRPQGIIFQTNAKPDYILPFDLVLLSATNNIIVHYYRIKENLHIYYNHTLIPNFEKFIFKDFSSMIEKYPSPKIVWKEVNRFRKENGFDALPKQKYRLAEYNEAVFHRHIAIKPIALFGYRPETRIIAKKLKIPYYISAKKFYESIKKPKSNKELLIIGRFQPMHLGHVNLIKRYHNAGFFIKIGIGSSENKLSQKNPLTKKEREEIIKKAMNEMKIKNFKIFQIPDINNDSNYVKHVLKIVGEFDTIVTGNKKVLRLFKKYKTKNYWNIESFDESSGRPGGKITSGIIRKRWLRNSDKRDLFKSTFDYLKSINFSERLKKIKSSQ